MADGDVADELSQPLDSARLKAAAACDRARELCQRTERVLTENHALRGAVRDARRARQGSPAHREILQRSEYARLVARLQTMPVIEQAKGVIMAQSHCREAEAFDMLRRASQRSNVPVRELAARIVSRAAGMTPDTTRNRSVSKIS